MDKCKVCGMAGQHKMSCRPINREMMAFMDKHGNKKALEGCDRCLCGCKYWENDVCVSGEDPFEGSN